MKDYPVQLHRFGRCVLDSEKKVLWCDSQPVSLPLKAVELLSVLVERRGQVVTKDEIWSAVWQDSFVEETNLTHNIYLLRKTFRDLGEPEIIQTVPRRGYRFSGDIVPTNGDLVIEKHSLTRTLIEELPADDAPTVDPRFKRRAIYAIGGIAAVIVAGLFFWGYNGAGSSSPPNAIRSLAVLPPKPLDAEPQNRSLSLGLADQLITKFGSLDRFTVRPFSSVESFLVSGSDPIAFGETLDVDAVLEGTIQAAAGRVRINLRLLSVRDGVQIWARSFDADEADLLEMQDSLANEIAASLKVDLGKDEQAAFSKRYTDNRDAYMAYLKGRFFFDKRNSTSYLDAIAEYERAIALDPSFALAYSGLADVYSMQIRFNGPRHLVLRKARMNAERALELDENLAEAHTSLAGIYRNQDWNWEASEKHYKRAIELNPNYVNARQWYALLLVTLGRLDEAMFQIEKAREIDPVSRVVLQNYLAVITFRRETHRILELSLQIAKLQEDESARYRDLAIAYHRVGDDEKTLEAAEQLMRMHNGATESVSVDARLGVVYERLGKSDKASRIFAALEKRVAKDAYAGYHLAMAYADLGRHDRALEMLQICLNARDDRLVWIKVEPRFDPLRGDPRFQEILQKMNLS